MCMLYVIFVSKVRPKTFGCVAMCSAVLFMFRSRLLVYSAGYGMNIVQVVLSGFSVKLLCFVQANIFSCNRPCVCRGLNHHTNSS